MNRYILNTTQEEVLLEQLDVQNIELDHIGILEQIIFSFPFRNRTIFKNISQHYSYNSNFKDVLSGDSYLSENIGSGLYNKKDFYEVMDDFVYKLSNSFKSGNLFLTGGYDSRFLLNCIDSKVNLNCFTYYYGNSFEKNVANKIADIHNRPFFPIEVKPEWYKNVPNFYKHRGLLPSHSWVLPNLCLELFQYTNAPFIHGFMGDPIFGDKAIIKDRFKSADQIIENYYKTKINRYKIFLQFDLKKYENDILNDIYLEYNNLKIHYSNADIEEIFFIKKRQQMIYKIIDSIPSDIKIICPFYEDKKLIEVALCVNQEDRINKNLFFSYAREKFPNSLWNINADNPFGLNAGGKNMVRKLSNTFQYIIEKFNPLISLSPFQHEHLRTQCFKNKSYLNLEIKDFVSKTDLSIDWRKSLNRKYNSIDLPYSISSIGRALKNN